MKNLFIIAVLQVLSFASFAQMEELAEYSHVGSCVESPLPGSSSRTTTELVIWAKTQAIEPGKSYKAISALTLIRSKNGELVRTPFSLVEMHLAFDKSAKFVTINNTSVRIGETKVTDRQSKSVKTCKILMDLVP